MEKYIPLASLLLNLVFGGTLLNVWLKHRISVRQLDLGESEQTATRKRSDFDRALEVVTGQRDDAFRRIEALEHRQEQQDQEIQGLRLARDLDPFPNWIIGLDGAYLYVNREFERFFLEPQGKTYRDVVGKRHEDLWPTKFCQTLKNLDAIARRVPDGQAKATTEVELNGGRYQATVHKFPMRIREAVVSYAGFITEWKNIEETIG